MIYPRDIMTQIGLLGFPKTCPRLIFCLFSSYSVPAGQNKEKYISISDYLANIQKPLQGGEPIERSHRPALKAPLASLSQELTETNEFKVSNAVLRNWCMH